MVFCISLNFNAISLIKCYFTFKQKAIKIHILWPGQVKLLAFKVQILLGEQLSWLALQNSLLGSLEHSGFSNLSN